LKNNEIIDTSSEVFGSLKNSRRRLLRVVSPILFVVILLAALLGTAMFSYYSNRHDVLALSEDLLNTIEQRIAIQIKDYLIPVEDTLRLTADFLKATTFDVSNRALLEPIGFRILTDLQQVSLFHVSDTHGNFFMLKEMPDGALDTKMIDRSQGAAQATWIHRDPEGNLLNEETSRDDSYDPRNRLWYEGAVKDRDIFWSKLYIFFADQKPGITAAIPIIGAHDQILGVVGLDIELTALSDFLKNLKIGQDGQAMIVGEDGRLAAHPDVEKLIKKQGEEYQRVFIEDLEDPLLNRAFNRFKIDGYGHHDLVVNNIRYLFAAFSLLEPVGRDWSVIILVPEKDFVGFVSRNNRTVLMMSIAIVILASVMTALLIIQGLRADRSAQLVLDRQHELEAQHRAFAELSSDASLFDREDSESLSRLTEVVTKASDGRRTSVWQLEDDDEKLRCIDCYDQESDGHTRDTVLSAADLPELFNALKQGEEIRAPSAVNDKRLTALYEVYLQPMGCESLLALPVRFHDRIIGALWFEHERLSRNWSVEEISFAHSIATMLSLRYADDLACGRIPAVRDKPMTTDAPAIVTTEGARRNLPADEPRPAAHQKTPAPVAKPHRLVSFSERLVSSGIDPDRLGAEIFPDVSVLVLRFSDPLSIAERAKDKPSLTMIDHFVQHFQELAEAGGVDYMRIMGDRIVCAAGIDDQSTDHANMIANLALHIQDHCTGQFADLDTPMEFRIGMDTGAVMGSKVGRDKKTYNIWGEAVQFASKMVGSGIPGGIQVSETTYRRLRNEYLFKARGKYYLPDIGETSTYLLTGRI